MRLFRFRSSKKLPKKYRTIRLARWLEDALQFVWGKKIWVLTYSVAIAAVYVLGNLGKGLPDELFTDQGQKELRKAQIMEDVGVITETGAKIDAARESIIPVVEYIPEIKRIIVTTPTPDGKASLSLDQAKAEVGYKKVHEARTRITTAIASVKTVKFQSSTFVDLFKGYEEDFRDVDNMLAVLERIFNSVITADTVGIVENLNQLDKVTSRYQEAMQSLELRTTYVAKQLNNIFGNFEIEVKSWERDLLIFGIRTLIWMFMAGLTIFLGVLAFKSRKTTKLYSASQGGRPDLAKAQIEKYKIMRRK